MIIFIRYIRRDKSMSAKVVSLPSRYPICYILASTWAPRPCYQSNHRRRLKSAPLLSYPNVTTFMT